MNIFSVLRLRDEKYHNRMLTWLLDPQESHELGSRFLAEFLNLVDIRHEPETFIQIEPEYTIYASDNLKKRKPDIYLQTDGAHIFIENKVRRNSIDDDELKDQADYIRSKGYDPVIHIFIVPSLKDIPASTRATIQQNGIQPLQWSALTKILDEILHQPSVEDDVRTILEQYGIYLKEHIMEEFMGFNIAEMQQYVDYTFYKYIKMEKQARGQIEAFLNIVGEEILDRVIELTKQNDWETWAENLSSNLTINLGLYIARPQYRDMAFFGVCLYYFPDEQNDKILHASITLEVEVKLVNTIRQRFEDFKAHNPLKHDWGENQFEENFFEFYEDWQIEWSQLENWQKTKSSLVERTTEWMKEFTPILEEQIGDKNF